MTESPAEPVPPTDAIDSEVTLRALLEILPSHMAWRYRAIPLDLQARKLTVGMVGPRQEEALAELRELTAYDVEVVPLGEAVFDHLYASFYADRPPEPCPPADRSAPGMPRLVRALQEASVLLSTSSEFLGWAMVCVFALAAVAVFYYYAQFLVVLVFHFVLHPLFLALFFALLVGGFLIVRYYARPR